eukprot:TRINITY_DN6341_c0_g2_i1.p3 TRINITY_DN6341_c0_g2~~TRINITY_DN6341_c0_g2_i1.p3  ORF type:complete len:120 (+),score=0.91 TRINITY_DN6341_c0_g2_i1:1466-1825(+)
MINLGAKSPPEVGMVRTGVHPFEKNSGRHTTLYAHRSMCDIFAAPYSCLIFKARPLALATFHPFLPPSPAVPHGSTRKEALLCGTRSGAGSWQLGDMCGCVCVCNSGDRIKEQSDLAGF